MVATTRLASLEKDPAAPRSNVDWLLLIITLLLTCAGAAMIHSATKGFGNPASTAYLGKEILFILVSWVVLAAVMLIDYERIRRWAPLMYLLVLLSLVGVLAVGSNRKGAQAWFALGPLQLQPSEPAKAVLVVTLAAYLSANRERLNLPRVIVALVLAGLPVGLILLQPDLGTMLVFVVVAFGMLVVAGVRGRYLAVLAAVGIIGMAVVLNSGVLENYQRDRLTVFIKGESQVAQGAGYNLEQSKIAIGLGGLTGWGYGRGPQTQNDFVPEQQTDFIFTVVGEELGFVGGATLLLLFALLSLRILRAAALARDDFGTLVCVGFLLMIVFQVFQNVGMSMGIMPITGLPLPFVSYGGSSLLTTYAGIGMVLNIRMRRFR
jgi:rod shape determining protein RodA